MNAYLREHGFRVALVIGIVLLTTGIVSACGGAEVVSTAPTAASSTAPSLSQAPPAESACTDFASLQRTLRELPVRDIATGPTEALLNALATAIVEANALKASAGGALAQEVAAFVAALETAQLVIQLSSPQPIMSDGVESDAFKSLDAVADAWIKVTYAMQAICPAASPWPFG